jgi:hypothetical protein
VILNFCDYLPFEKFGIVAHSSIDRPDIPPKKGFVRASMGGGWILRELTQDTTHVVYCYYGDGGGKFSNLPKAVMRAFNKLEMKKIKRLKKKYEEAKSKGLIVSKGSKSSKSGETEESAITEATDFDITEGLDDDLKPISE